MQKQRWMAIAAAFGIMACNPEVKNGAPIGRQPLADDFRHLVAGPNVDGIWKSACVADAREAGKWDLLTLIVQGQNVARRTVVHSDAACAHAEATRDEQGRMRYLKDMPSGAFAVEYRFRKGAGDYTQYENFKLAEPTLWVSNEVGGVVEPDVRLVRQGAAPTPTPTLSPPPMPPAVPGGPCGTAGDVAQRVAHCQSAKTSASGKVWQLVTRTTKGNEVWRDVTTGKLWGDELYYVWTQLRVAEGCALPQEQDSNGNIAGLDWHAPTRAEYQAGEVDGLREVTPGWASRGFPRAYWTADVNPRDSNWAYLFEAGVFRMNVRENTMPLRCVAGP